MSAAARRATRQRLLRPARPVRPACPRHRTTDLIGTLPRQIGETLAHSGGLQVLPCPIAIPGFTVKQHWHARFHQDPANQWLRGVCADVFMGVVKGN